MDLFLILLCGITVLYVVAGCKTNRRVIKNEVLDDWDGKRMRPQNMELRILKMGETYAAGMIDFLLIHSFTLAAPQGSLSN
jgi:hypothetical protein